MDSENRAEYERQGVRGNFLRMSCAGGAVLLGIIALALASCIAKFRAASQQSIWATAVGAFVNTQYMKTGSASGILDVPTSLEMWRGIDLSQYYVEEVNYMPRGRYYWCVIDTKGAKSFVLVDASLSVRVKGKLRP